MLLCDFWILVYSRMWRHGDLKPKRFDFCIEYKPIDRTDFAHGVATSERNVTLRLGLF